MKVPDRLSKNTRRSVFTGIRGRRISREQEDTIFRGYVSGDDPVAVARQLGIPVRHVEKRYKKYGPEDATDFMSYKKDILVINHLGVLGNISKWADELRDMYKIDHPNARIFTSDALYGLPVETAMKRSVSWYWAQRHNHPVRRMFRPSDVSSDYETVREASLTGRFVTNLNQLFV